MSNDYDTRIETTFDILSQKQYEIDEDPELAALHTEASRHFYAALDYQRNNCPDSNIDYELEQVRESLDTFEEVKAYEKEF